MKKPKSLIGIGTVLFLGVLVNACDSIFYQKSLSATEAVFKVPNSSIEIVLERRSVHLFLSEYERTLCLRAGKVEMLREKVAVDTGGYSLMRVYQTSPTNYFLSGDLSFDRYYLDLAQPFLQDADEKPRNAVFLGVFDRDENRVWRFVPAHEREEQKSTMELTGGSF